MGGLLILRLLAGLLYDLTTDKIRLQLAHVFCFRQKVRNSQFFLYLVLLSKLFSLHPICPPPLLLYLERPSTLFLLKLASFGFALFFQYKAL